MPIIEGTEHRVDQYTVVGIDEYNGQLKLASMWERDERRGVEWVCPVFDGEPRTKEDGSTVMIPFAVKLGEPKDAVKLLRKLADTIEKGGTPRLYEKPPEGGFDDGDDFPPF